MLGKNVNVKKGQSSSSTAVPKMNVYGWHRSGDITDEQKTVLAKFFSTEKDNEHKYYLGDLKKVYDWHNILERNKNKTAIPGEIEDMRFFSAWWNHNLLIVVNKVSAIDESKDKGKQASSSSSSTKVGESKKSRYGVWLIVYEMPSRKMAEILEKFQISTTSYKQDDLKSAKDRVKALAVTLKGEHPILYNEPVTIRNVSDRFSSFYNNGEVERIEVPFAETKANPDAYFKPLDIVEMLESYGGNAYAPLFSVYLGNRKVACMPGDELNGFTITDWEWFFLHGRRGSYGVKKIYRCHPIIPFKKPEMIIEHIAKMVDDKPASKKYFSITGKYSSGNGSEQFVHRAVLGLNLSKLTSLGTKFTNLRELLDDNKEKINSLVGNVPRNKITEIESYRNQAIAKRGQSQGISEGVEMQAVIELRPIHYKLK